MLNIKSIRDTFYGSQQRYSQYYLERARFVGQTPIKETETELSNYEKAFSIALQETNHIHAYNFWEALSTFLWEHGYWQKYSEWGDNTLQALKRTGNNRMAEGRLISEIGYLKLEWGDWESAKALFSTAKDIFYEANDQHWIAVIERYIGVLSYRIGNYDDASKHWETASDIAQQNQFQLMLVELYNLQGSLERKRKNSQAARQLYRKSMELAESLGDKWYLTGAIRNIAQLDADLGNLIDAQKEFQEAIDLCTKIDRKDMLYGCQLKLANVEAKLGNLDGAFMLGVAARDGYRELGIKSGVDDSEEFLLSLAK